MEKKIFLHIFLTLISINIYLVKNDYVYFDLYTFKNNSQYEEEYLNYFFDNFNNSIYSKILLGPNKEQFIMEIKSDKEGFTIFNHNCDIPPVDSSGPSSYLPTLADSSIIDYVDDNMTINFGEYYTYVLENTIYIQTNNGEKSTKVDFVFSPRNDTNYIKKLVLRPYTCFNLGFIITFINHIEEIDKVDDYSLNLIFQFKKNRIISSYNWFIEYNDNDKEKAKLVIGIKPKDYNPQLYQEISEKIINELKRKDNKIYWDIEMNEIYVKDSSNQKETIEYLKCSLEPSLGVIIGPVRYKFFLEDNIFKPLMNENKCFKKDNILGEYIIYYCKKETKDNKKNSKYSTVYFLHRFFRIIFELNYNDLFEEKGDYIFCKVFFIKDEIDIWRMGKPFLSKYFFSYNLDGRTISFYGGENEEQTENKSSSSSNTALIIIIIILILLFAVLGFFIGKYIYSSKKRKKGTELMENDKYDYNIGDINPE